MKRSPMAELEENMSWPSIAATLLVALALTGCNALTGEERPWSFVTSVGGLEISPPVHKGESWLLPVRADVSGLQAITHKPTTMNSGLVCDFTKARVKGQDIFIVIVTTLPHEGATSVCPAATLGALEPGQYNVWYGSNRTEGVQVGTVDVAL